MTGTLIDIILNILHLDWFPEKMIQTFQRFSVYQNILKTRGGQLIWKKTNDDDLSHVYIPGPLTSVHLDVRVVNFTAQVEVIKE